MGMLFYRILVGNQGNAKGIPLATLIPRRSWTLQCFTTSAGHRPRFPAPVAEVSILSSTELARLKFRSYVEANLVLNTAAESLRQ